jgi:hypothetical protein
MSRIYTLLFAFLPFFSFAQEDKNIVVSPDLHVRTFWMSTSYQDDFKNDFALGTSVNLGGKAKFENFEFHVGYRVFANLWSSDLTVSDPLSGQANRYEVGLFDLLNPSDRLFGKLETLSISYQKSNRGVTLGRMGINSDWINAQDGRLSPTAIEGVHTWFKSTKNWKFDLWVISRMSIRGSSEWLGVGETVGVFPVARGVDGRPSSYFGNTKSDWIGIFELSKQWKSLSLSFSNTLVDNISNTAWLATENSWNKSTDTWFTGVQAGFQNGLGEGGNSDLRLAYKNPKDQNWATSGRFGWKNKIWTSHISYTKTGGNGRWLSPREWGKDAWYTFIPRERNEGYQSVEALAVYAERRLSKLGLTAYLHLGFHWLPDMDDSFANKYNSPSYRQLNLGLKYKPQVTNRFDFHFIVMNKESIEKVDLTPAQHYNKVGLWHVNLIANFRLNSDKL